MKENTAGSLGIPFLSVEKNIFENIQRNTGQNRNPSQLIKDLGLWNFPFINWGWAKSEVESGDKGVCSKVGIFEKRLKF